MVMHQNLEPEQTDHPGHTDAEWAAIVRRAAANRAAKEGQLSPESVTASAAELGISEKELREAERQLHAEQAAAARRQRLARGIGAGVAGVLALFLIVSYNSLNTARQAALTARADLQAALQRRADVVPLVEQIAREGAANERAVVDRLAQTQQGLRSSDLNTQLRADAEFKKLVTQAGSSPQARPTELYRDLMAQIEGTENRINVARQRYNGAASNYNRLAQSFPTALGRAIFGLPAELPLFEAAPGAASAPRR
jgi:LemA protein